MRLLCDEMLKGVGRWLRAAGYDVAIVDDSVHDDDLLARAAAEHRLLLTCDRKLAERAGPNATVAVLGSERFEGAARELRQRLGVDWLHAPFTRCLLDNTPLMPANEEAIANLPATARQGGGPIMRCPECNRLYWPGSHVRRMLAKLTRAQAERLRGDPSDGTSVADFVGIRRSKIALFRAAPQHRAPYGSPLRLLVTGGAPSSGDAAGRRTIGGDDARAHARRSSWR
jgi:uncharacterized protein with PIN domain